MIDPCTAHLHLVSNILLSGAFQIYRAPGSVAFLRSGSALQPILPKSQAWCLDEQSSKFVLQIRRPNYWRIEVPVGNDEEIRRALVLREVLDKILQFEKTPCPFERNFTVTLPERPTTPVKKRTWTPPARTVTMHWPPGQPITPPPEFPSRTRFYNPGARRFSDFGIDTSKLGLTPATSPQKSEQIQEEGEKPDTPSRRARFEESTIAGRPLMEEPEPLSPPPTAIPASIAQVTAASSPKNYGALKSEHVKPEPVKPEPIHSQPAQEPVQPPPAPTDSDTKTTEISIRKREPIWITKQVPSSTTRKVKRPVAKKTQSEGPVVRPAQKPTDESCQADPREAKANGDSMPLESSTKSDTPSEATDESEAEGGALQGSGQLRVRRTRVAAFASRRAATAPSLRLRVSSTSTTSSSQEQEAERQPQEPVRPDSPAESTDSFFSMESWHSPLSPAVSPTFSPSEAYPYPHENIPLNKGQLSGFTTTPTVSGWDRNSVGAAVGSGARTPDTPFTDVQDEDFDQAAENKPKVTAVGGSDKEPALAVPIAPENVLEDDDAAAASDVDSLSTSWSSAASRTSSCSNSPMRHRAATTSVAISHRNPRALSPLPPAANLLTLDLHNRASSTARAIRRIPSSIFNKTCEILISPPAHLISLMLKVAERITAGEWRGFTFGMGEDGEVLDVRWDWSDDGEVDMGSMRERWGDDVDLDLRSSLSRRSRASFAAADLSLPSPTRKAILEYQDPWATPPEEPDQDEGEAWSQSWGVD